MYECYTLEIEGAGVRFVPHEGKELAYLPGQPPKSYTLVNVIGDPGLLHCAVFRKAVRAAFLPCMILKACFLWPWPKVTWPTAWGLRTWAVW